MNALKLLKISNANEYIEVIQHLNSEGIYSDNGRIMLWDATRKPRMITLKNDYVEINGEGFDMANFDTVPYVSIEEFRRWKKALTMFLEKEGSIPLTVEDFKRLRKMV